MYIGLGMIPSIIAPTVHILYFKQSEEIDKSLPVGYFKLVYLETLLRKATHIHSVWFVNLIFLSKGKHT